MPAYPLGSFDIHIDGQSVTFPGRKLDGRQRGEQVSIPVEGDQGATESYLIRWQDQEAFARVMLGTKRDVGNGKIGLVAARHPVFRELRAVAVSFAPSVPLKPFDAPDAGDPTEDSQAPALVSQALAASGTATPTPEDILAYSSNWLVGIQDTVAVPPYLDPLPSLPTPGDYRFVAATVQYGEDRGWVEVYRYSGRTATVTGAVTSGPTGSQPYTVPLTVPFPEYAMTLTRKRLANFRPGEISQYCQRLNKTAIKLPSGTEIGAGCAYFATFDCDYHKVTYGVPYWSVSLQFLVQPWSWNLIQHRLDGSLQPFFRNDRTTPFFDTFDVNEKLLTL
jgi:hypothetical protein